MPNTVIVYGKSDCPWTSRARKALFAEKKTVEYRDVVAHPEFLEEMIKLTGGQRMVPVIVEKGKVTIGFEGAG
jgi:glutaredoxin 3